MDARLPGSTVKQFTFAAPHVSVVLRVTRDGFTSPARSLAFFRLNWRQLQLVIYSSKGRIHRKTSKFLVLTRTGALFQSGIVYILYSLGRLITQAKNLLRSGAYE